MRTCLVKVYSNPPRSSLGSGTTDDKRTCLRHGVLYQPTPTIPPTPTMEGVELLMVDYCAWVERPQPFAAHLLLLLRRKVVPIPEPRARVANRQSLGRLLLRYTLLSSRPILNCQRPPPFCRLVTGLGLPRRGTGNAKMHRHGLATGKAALAVVGESFACHHRTTKGPARQRRFASQRWT